MIQVVLASRPRIRQLSASADTKINHHRCQLSKMPSANMSLSYHSEMLFNAGNSVDSRQIAVLLNNE